MLIVSPDHIRVAVPHQLRDSPNVNICCYRFGSEPVAQVIWPDVTRYSRCL